jgi:hypothetical protein
MTPFEDLLGRTDTSVPPTASDHVVVVTSQDDPAELANCLFDWFGDDSTITGLRLVVDGADRGVLGRSTALSMATSFQRAGLGGGDYATMPGHSVGYVRLSLVCPVDGCAVTAKALSYDEDDPPLCPVHKVGLRRADT